MNEPDHADHQYRIVDLVDDPVHADSSCVPLGRIVTKHLAAAVRVLRKRPFDLGEVLPDISGH